MPRKYDPETGARAVRLAIGHPEDYASEFETIRTVAGRLGMKPETLRKWIRQPRSITAGNAGLIWRHFDGLKWPHPRGFSG